MAERTQATTPTALEEELLRLADDLEPPMSTSSEITKEHAAAAALRHAARQIAEWEAAVLPVLNAPTVQQGTVVTLNLHVGDLRRLAALTEGRPHG